MDKLSPAGRVFSVLHGEIPKKTPFTIYETKLSPSSDERDLRNRGLCLVKRVTSYGINYNGISTKQESYTDPAGRHLTRTVYGTPLGELSTLTQPAGFTTWTHERMFKTPGDYKKLRALLQSAVVAPRYDAVAGLMNELGEDYVVRDNLPLEPLQALISNYMGVEAFCVEWMDNRDEILKLYNILVETARKVYPLVAEGPLPFANYGGNVIPEVVGEKNFKEYFVPHYNEAAEILHKKGKLIGCHLDGNNAPIMDAVAETDLDYIEAYDAGMSPPVGEALAKWPGKTIWLNWPSGWQLDPLSKVYDKTYKMLSDASPGNRLIMGITEDVPAQRLIPNCKAIMQAIEDYDKARDC